MAKIKFNKQNEVDMPTLLLQNRNFDNLGKLICTSDLVYKDNFNSPNELSFKTYKTLNGKKNPLWDDIVDCKIIYIPAFKDKFEIKVAYTDENTTYKTITGTALAESELSQVKLYDIEINTSDDIARADYDVNFPTVFYRVPNISFYDSIFTQSKYAGMTDEQKIKIIKSGSLLHRLLEKAYNYTIDHVDTSLTNLTKIAQFSISDTTIYDELINEISNEYGCLFLFDSVNRTVSAYDLYNTCSDCGYRGDFNDVCPVCGSKNFSGQYGKQTTILVKDSNLATQIQKESDLDSLKNTFRVEGGDDNINAAIASVNPNGTRYIYYFSPDTIDDMPSTLVSSLNSYNALYSEYKTTHSYNLNSTNVTNYNSVINYIKTYFADTKYTTISSPIVGYDNTTTLLYNAIDLQSYLQTAMMPTITIDNLTIEQTMALLVASNLSPIAVTNPSTAVQKSVDNAVLGMAKVLVNTALYTVEISESTYTSGTTGTWIGKFKLTSIADKTSTLVGDSITLSITNNVETYIKQKIDKLMAKSDIDEALDLSNMDMTLDTFKSRLHYYSIDYLNGLHTEFESVISIILENKDTMADLYTNFYSTYNNRIVAIDTEIVTRTAQLSSITAIYNEIVSLRSTVQTTLNLQSYLGDDLWKTFCSYRREDKYANSDYISDGLTNAEVIGRAKELLAKAQQELYKAGNIQYSMTTTMNNLLTMKEFLPIRDDFESGNWLHIQTDDTNYKLRLLSYEVQFEDLKNINVTFSTVSKIWNSVSDVKSVIDSARSIAGSYSNVTQQVYKSTESTAKVNSWVDNGLDTTVIKVVNDVHNATVVTDKNGILLREHDDITDTFSDTQCKFLPSGVYVTDDAWETVKSALGKYAYIDPVSGETKIAFGLLAQTVVGKLILSEKNVITNGSDTVQIDETGIKIYHGTNLVFSVDTSGNGVFKGEIQANSGKIGGFTINNTTLSGNSNSLIVGGILQSTGFSMSNVVYDANGNVVSGTITDGIQVDLTNMRFRTPQITIAKDYIECNGYTTFGKRKNGSMIGILSHAEGMYITASGNYSHAEGYYTTASVYASHAEGNITTASGYASHAEGNNTTASGAGSHAEGDITTASGDYSHAEGSQTTASGDYSHAEGSQTIASGDYSHVEGYSTTSSGFASHAEGSNTTASGNYSHVEGKYNIADVNNQYAHIIGNGVDNEHRANIFAVDWAGNVHAGSYIPMTDNIFSIGDATHRPTSVYAINGTIQTSDRNKKNSIRAILPIYEELFMQTVTVQYMFNDGDRVHFGVISQCFESLMRDIGLKDTDCAAFCKDIHYIYDKDEYGQDIPSTKRPEVDKNGNTIYDYSFRYTEFIMLTVHMVQKTIKRVDILEETAKTQQSNIEELQTTIQSQQIIITSQQETITNQQSEIQALQDKQKSLKAEQEKQNKIIQALCVQLGLDTTAIA